MSCVYVYTYVSAVSTQKGRNCANSIRYTKGIKTSSAISWKRVLGAAAAAAAGGQCCCFNMTTGFSSAKSNETIDYFLLAPFSCLTSQCKTPFDNLPGQSMTTLQRWPWIVLHILLFKANTSALVSGLEASVMLEKVEMEPLTVL